MSDEENDSSGEDQVVQFVCKKCNALVTEDQKEEHRLSHEPARTRASDRKKRKRGDSLTSESIFTIPRDSPPPSDDESRKHKSQKARKKQAAERHIKHSSKVTKKRNDGG